MKRSEELYADFVFEYGVEDFVFGVAFVQSVAVSYKELLSVFFKAERFAVKDKSEFFFKVISLPKVVIAEKKCILQPASLFCASFPRNRTYPLGTTYLYSNQKSNMSPRR